MGPGEARRGRAETTQGLVKEVSTCSKNPGAGASGLRGGPESYPALKDHSLH